MNFSNVEFFLKEAWTGFRRSGIMSIVSVGIVTVSLVIFGVFIIVIMNFGNVVGSIGSKMEISVYIDKDINDIQANNIVSDIKKIEGVDNVKYISKDISWIKFKEDFEGKLELGELVRENPLPNTFVIKAKYPSAVALIAKRVSNMTIIDEVRYSGNLAERMGLLLRAVKIGGFVLIGLLGFATLLIVVNTIRLTVISRQTDITIMKLVGATDTFIKWPFIIEGILIGVIGAAFSLVVLKFSYDSIVYKVQDALPWLPLITSKAEITMIYTVVAVVGVALGMLGGYISVSRQLKEVG